MDKHRFLRQAALSVSACFVWSFGLAGSVHAMTYRAPVAPGHSRALAAGEMSHIVGATPLPGDPGGGSGVGGDNAGASPGPTPSWIGSAGGVNTATGSKLTSLPIVSWTARGGLPVSFSLFHASLGNRMGSFGAKWSESYFSSLAVWSNGNVTAYWDDQTAYTFTKNVDGSFTPPPGIHDTLTYSSGTDSYDLVTKSQVRYHFAHNAAFSNVYYFNASIQDENGNKITINQDAATGHLNSIVDPTGRTITFGYSGGHLSTVTDPLSRVWTLGYDGNGRISTVTLPPVSGNSYFVQVTYDSGNNVNGFRDARGNWSYSAFNGDSTAQSETDACGNATTFSYTSTATTITDPNGHATVHTYASGRLASVTDPLSYTESYTYDTNNNRTQVQDRRGNVWKSTFDGMGNVLTAQAPPTPENSAGNITHVTYNSHNKPLTITAPSGRGVAITYDGSDNVTQVRQSDQNGTVYATTNFTVSAATYGLVTDKYDANSHHYAYGHDANGDLSDVTTPLGNHTHWVFNALGAATSRTDAMGRATTYTLDGWEQVIGVRYPGGAGNKTFSYDADSNLTGFANDASAGSRVFDADGRLTQEQTLSSTYVRHSYDAGGQKGLLSATTDPDGRVYSYGYTARNQVASVSDSGDGVTSYVYDAGGNLSNSTRPNGSTFESDHDAADRAYRVVNSMSWGGSWSYNYTFDTDSRRVQEYDYSSGSTETWAYDGLGRMTGDVRTGSNTAYNTYSQDYSESYQYDACGNRTSKSDPEGGNLWSRDADDEVTGANNSYWNFGYDADGERTSSTLGGHVTTFGYDFDGRLTSIAREDGTTTFQYDALGRRQFRTAAGQTTVYTYDGDKPLREYVEQTGGATRSTWGPDGLILRNGPGVHDYPLSDGRGDVRVAADAGENMTAYENPDGVGNGRGSGGQSATLASPYGWGTGSGYRAGGDGPYGSFALVECGARYYDPETGSFLTRDTDLGQSPYAYCGGDPVNLTDPSGHDPDAWAALGVGSGGLFGLLTLGQGASTAGAAAGGTFVPSAAAAGGIITLGVITIGALSYAAYKFIGEPMANHFYGPDTYPELPAPSLPIRERPDPREPVMFKFYVPVLGGNSSGGGFGDSSQQSKPPIRNF